jgi:steroid 5-alpha reductase family enzyme
MNPFFYIKAFAWISIVALACSVFAGFWLPMLAGAVVITLLISAVNSSRR